MGLIQRRAPTRWNDIDFVTLTTPTNPFTAFNTWLTPLGMTADQMLLYFTIDYEEALTEYPEDLIDNILHMVATSNTGKYDKLLAAYTAQYDPLDELTISDNYTDTRRPNLTSQTNAGSKLTTTITNKQTRTDTETPNNYTNTIENQKAPYDSETYKAEAKSIQTASGSRSTSISYTGDPDESHTDTTNNSKTTETGSETIEHYANKTGRNKSPQQLLDEELALAERMNIFKMIERDIAAKLFIGVWPTF